MENTDFVKLGIFVFAPWYMGPEEVSQFAACQKVFMPRIIIIRSALKWPAL